MKFLIVDDHPLFREGLAAVLRQSAPGTSVEQAGDVGAALALAERHPDFDAVILDLTLPDVSGFAALAELGRARPDLPVVVLSSSEDTQNVRHALAQGALGYVPKSADPQTLLAALRLVLNGDIYVPPLILGEASAAPSEPRADARGAGLTERQLDVLRRVSEGHSNGTIAAQLDISEKTVKAHVAAIFRAFGVVNRTQAAAAGRRSGVI